MTLIPYKEEVDKLKQSLPLIKLMAKEIHAISLYLNMENPERWRKAYQEAERYMNEWEKRLSK